MPKIIETYNHEEDKRKNIPTAEFESVVQKEQLEVARITYPRQNTQWLNELAALHDMGKATPEFQQRIDRELDPQLIWRGKDEQDWSDLVVQAPPLYIQEKVHPKVLLNELLRETKEGRHNAGLITADLFADFNGIPRGVDKTEFYQHDQNWSNRMILGDSLQVMASLAERESLRGKVQCIYFDPPYGIKFNSNFQWSTTSRDVKDGKAEHITREPEQVKAFRDTWRDGIHSYLTYLRDRLTVARDLLTESGSIFVQIGDENVHRVRAVMDEVFGEDNCVALIQFKKTGGFDSGAIASICDYVLWYSRDKNNLKYRPLFEPKIYGEGSGERYKSCLLSNGEVIPSSKITLEDGSLDIPKDARLFLGAPLTSDGAPSNPFDLEFEGTILRHKANQHWKTTKEGLLRTGKAGRLFRTRSFINYRLFLDDFSATPVTNMWTDTMGTAERDKVYVVQTVSRIIQRCILMATDPGDLVLDPTCGSGTTAYVAEQWGRRWITIDTSRVSLALARARIMGARYPYYLLADSHEGQKKEAEVTRKAPSTQPTHGNLRHGFVYERVPHITLKAIANNAEIDVIWEEHEKVLLPLREQLSVVSGQWSVGGKQTTDHQSLTTNHLPLQEWEVPREKPEDWPEAAAPLLTQFWEARIARQKAIDASIAAKADFEYLYDKPYADKNKVRVAGPFTVESLSPHRMLGVDENDELIDPAKAPGNDFEDTQSFAQMILENLKTSGVQQADKQDKINFTSLTPWPGHYICAEGIYEVDGGQWLVDSEEELATNHSPQTTTRRAGIFIGPEFGTVQRADLVAAAREAGDAGFDVLIACAFNYEAFATEFNKLGRIPVLKARMNADLHMSDDLKNTGKGNLFVIFGEPDIEVTSGQWLVTSGGRMIANYECVKELSGVDSLAEINRLGGEDLPGFKVLSGGGKVQPHQSDTASGGVSAVEHRGGSGQKGNGRVSAVPEHSGRIAGGSGNATDHRKSAGDDESAGSGTATGTISGNRQTPVRTQTLAAIKTLKPADFPLQLTTNHWAQITVNGVDVFKPQLGKVESSGPGDIACWFIDTDYNEESFFVRHAYFLGAGDPYKSLKTTLKAEINREAWETLHSDISRPFEKPKSGRIAVKVINHLGDEVMKVFRVSSTNDSEGRA